MGEKARGMVCDLAEPGAAEKAINDAIAWRGRLELVCSNAGIGHNNKIKNESLGPQAERLFAVNCFAAVRVAQAYLHALEASGARGRLMITGSENSLSVADGGERQRVRPLRREQTRSADYCGMVKCIVRDNIGSFKERNDMERWLNDWIKQYVDYNPDSSGEITKAQKPLSAAEVVVEEIPGNPGYYSSKFFLRPHYQLEGLTVSLRLVSKLPSQKQQ